MGITNIVNGHLNELLGNNEEMARHDRLVRN